VDVPAMNVSLIGCSEACEPVS